MRILLCISFTLLSTLCLAQKHTIPSSLSKIGRSHIIESNDSDTSNTMKRLYRFNEFMEWYITYFPVPYASYSRETSWLFGVSKYNAFTLNKGNKKDSITQASSISFFGYYTLNRQYKTVLESNLMMYENKALWRSTFIYAFYPLYYYGVGNTTELKNQRTLNTAHLQMSSQYLFRLRKHWYLGPRYDLYDYSKVYIQSDSSPFPEDSVFLFNNSGIQSGLGIKLIMEGRDNRLNARKGYFVDVSYQIFDDALGSRYKYNHFLADGRYYFTPYKKVTIASQIRVESKYGDVPVQSLCFIGGDYNMRGTYSGRYRDKVSLDSQIELRLPIFWILGGVAFGSLGQVAPSYSDLAINAFHYNYGFGLRLKVDSEHDVNLRFDVGISSDQVSFIMNFSEAF